VTWLLVLLLLHADGRFEQTAVPVRSEHDCQTIGQAWAAQAVRRDSTDTAVFRCKARDTDLLRRP
jgi:hypothetical protein